MFIGGDTVWKYSDEAQNVAREAQLRGKWVHGGHGPNSWKRLLLVADSGHRLGGRDVPQYGPEVNGRLARWLRCVVPARHRRHAVWI